MRSITVPTYDLLFDWFESNYVVNFSVSKASESKQVKQEVS